MTETEYITKHKHNISKAVNAFMRKGKYNINGSLYEDLYQETTIALLEYYRQHNPAEDDTQFPWRTALHAMCCYVLTLQPLTGRKQTRRFTDVLKDMPVTITIDTVDVMGKRWEENTVTILDFTVFYQALKEHDRAMVYKRLAGLTVNQIAVTDGVTNTAISKRLRRIRRAYNYSMS